MSTHPKGHPVGSRHRLPLGLDGLFRGLGQVRQLAHRIAETAPEDVSGAVEVTQTGSTGIPKLTQAVYDASVRIGPRVPPPRRAVRTVRRNARNGPVVDDVREPAAGVLDEGDHFLVVIDLPGVQDQVQWSLRDQHALTIRAVSADRNYHSAAAPQPNPWRIRAKTEPVDDRDALSMFATGVLELRLWKRRPR